MDQEEGRVLALLAFNTDRIVPTCLIAQELWSDGPLPHTDSRVVSHIASVRRLLSSMADAELLTSAPGGYRLDSSGWILDAHRFERDLGAGFRAMAAGDAARAAERLYGALSLWKGEVLAGLPQGAVLRSYTRRLEQSRATALEQWAATELQLGRHRERLGELGVFAARYASHQGLHKHYIRALLRCGRTVEALRVYERLNLALRREGSTEMSLELLRLRRRIVSAAGDLREGSTGLPLRRSSPAFG
ncbi:MAG TPA: AfsR/SARP family transcriptional regulator [Streptomyces sp.]